jgi:pseudouridine synthase
VGRLDRDSEGLILLTDDGDWTQQLLHPRYQVEREYAVALRVPLGGAQANALRDGIELDEGLATLVGLRLATRTETARLERDAGSATASTWYRAVLTQGWRRQLRRMFAAVGAPVERLVRVRIGTLRLDDMPPGSVRVLSSAERARLTASRSPS